MNVSLLCEPCQYSWLKWYFNLKLIVNKVPDLDVKYYLKKTTLFSKLNGILLTQGEEIPHAQGKGKAPPKPWKKMKSLSCVRLFVTPWTVAHQSPPFMGFSRQEYWSGLPLLSHVQIFVTPWTAVYQASCPPPSPGGCSDSRPLSWRCYLTISSAARFFFSFSLSQHQGLFQWVSSLHQVAKYWS